MRACCLAADDQKCRIIGDDEQCNPLTEVNSCDRPWWRDGFGCLGAEGQVYMGNPFCEPGDTQLCEKGTFIPDPATAVCCEVDCEGNVEHDMCELDAACPDGEMHACSF
jgi:hypothetical protein